MQGASKTTSRDVQPGVRGVPTLNKDVLRIAGIMPWGPLETATTISDFDHFRDVFAPGYGFLLNYETCAQMQQWFLGKGRKAVVTRVTHKVLGVTTATKATRTAQTAATAPTQGAQTGTVAAPFTLAAGDTFIGNVDAVGNQTLTITATAGLLECTNAENYALVTGQDITVKIDAGGVQTIAFLTAEFANIAAATAEEVAAVINAKIVGAKAAATSGGTKVTITSDRLGTGSSVEVTGGTANVALAFAGGLNSGAGNVSNVVSVSIAELKALLEATWTNGGGVTVSDSAGYMTVTADTAGSAGSILVAAASTADTKVGWDNATHSGTDGAAVNTLKIDGKYYGTLGNSITYDVALATNGLAAYFDMKVYLYGGLKETHRNLSMDSTDAQYVEDVINTRAGYSKLIKVTDQAAVGTPTQRKPAVATGQALTGGGDGLAGLNDADFYGSSTYLDGFYAFSQNPLGDILVCPDRPTVTLQNAALYMCETVWQGKCVFIPDPPDGSDKAAIAVHMASLTSTEYGTGMPWPRVLVPNPDKTIYGQADVIEIGPSCSWAARMAKNSQQYEDGEFHQPGNQVHGLLANVVGLEGETDPEARHEVRNEGVRDYVTDFRVNPIIEGQLLGGGRGVWVNDVQNLKPTSVLWASVGEVRGVAACRKDIEAYMETRRTQANSQENRLTDKDAIDGYLVGRTIKGCFASKSAVEAFYVNTDPLGNSLNNPLEQEAQNYHILVGLATARPSRFVDLQFTRDTRAIESYVQQQLAA